MLLYRYRKEFEDAQKDMDISVAYSKIFGSYDAGLTPFKHQFANELQKQS